MVRSKLFENVLVVLNQLEILVIYHRLRKVLPTRQLLVKVLQVILDVWVVWRHEFLVLEGLNVERREERVIQNVLQVVLLPQPLLPILF